MAKFKNYYQILGLEDFADSEAVKAAFRKLARQHHPDLNAGDGQAEEKFKAINEAYEVLNNASKRQLYDESLKFVLLKATPQSKAKAAGSASQSKAAKTAYGAPPKGKSTDRKAADKTAGTTPISDLFDTFFKKGFANETAKVPDPEDGVFRQKTAAKGQPQEKARRGEDVVVPAKIAPVEAEQGVVKTVNVQHNELCRRCAGTGKVSGKVCTGCNGEKITSRTKKIDVRIPAGVKQGSRVRVAKEGGRGSGGAENGDLFLQIEIEIDPSFRIEGLDVFSNLSISIVEAVLGGEISVPTLNGNVKMTIPPLTSTGKVFRLKEQGAKNGQNKGDHLVTVQITAPESLTPKEKELYEELARLRRI